MGSPGWPSAEPAAAVRAPRQLVEKGLGRPCSRMAGPAARTLPAFLGRVLPFPGVTGGCQCGGWWVSPGKIDGSGETGSRPRHSARCFGKTFPCFGPGHTVWGWTWDPVCFTADQAEVRGTRRHLGKAGVEGFKGAEGNSVTVFLLKHNPKSGFSVFLDVSWQKENILETQGDIHADRNSHSAVNMTFNLWVELEEHRQTSSCNTYVFLFFHRSVQSEGFSFVEHRSQTDTPSPFGHEHSPPVAASGLRCDFLTR